MMETYKKNNFLDYADIYIGAVGVILISIGLILTVPWESHILFVFGQIVLFCSAVIARNKFYGLLQVVTFLGALFGCFNFSASIKLYLLVFLSIIIISYFIYCGMFREDKSISIGVASLICLAIGYSINNNLITSYAFGIGGILQVIYAWCAIRAGNSVAWIFLALNIVFLLALVIRLFEVF